MTASTGYTTLDAIGSAYGAAVQRLARLDSVAFLETCLALGWREMALDVAIGDALMRLARDGSIEAAAALNVLAISDPGAEHLAEQALTAILRRNGAARDEIVEYALVQMLEETAVERGYVCLIDPATGEKRWRAP